MAITELKPYLSNIADAIKDKMFFPNLFDKDNAVVGKTAYVSDYGQTETGYYMITSSSSYPCLVYFDLGLSTNYHGKTLTLSFKRNIDDDLVYAEFLSMGANFTPNYYNQHVLMDLDGEDGLYTVSIPGSATNSNAHIVLRLYAYKLPVGTRVEFNDIMLTETSDPMPYRPYGSLPDKINAQEFADKITEAYDIGMYEQWSVFWDNLQMFGKRTDYSEAFKQYTDVMYKPKYPIKPKRASEMYYESYIRDLSDINWVGLNQLYWTFAQCKVLGKIGSIDLSGATESNVMPHAFYYCSSLETIAKIKLKEDGSQTFYNSFSQCNALKNIQFEGCIGTSISFNYSPLTNESAKGVLEVLKDYTGTSYAGTYKVTFKSTVKDALIAEGATAPGGLTWDEYVTAKGWTW